MNLHRRETPPPKKKLTEFSHESRDTISSLGPQVFQSEVSWPLPLFSGHDAPSYIMLRISTSRSKLNPDIGLYSSQARCIHQRFSYPPLEDRVISPYHSSHRLKAHVTITRRHPPPSFLHFSGRTFQRRISLQNIKTLSCGKGCTENFS
jgi:hypothetical protein